MLTVGVFGAGDVVAKSHLPCLAAMDRFDIEWIADVDSERGAMVAKNYSTSFYLFSERLCELPRTDIVLLAIPYGARYPVYDMLTGRDSALYVEKPFARTLAEHNDLCARFPDSRVAIGFQRRALGVVTMMKAMVSNEIFGRLKRVELAMEEVQMYSVEKPSHRIRTLLVAGSFTNAVSMGLICWFILHRQLLLDLLMFERSSIKGSMCMRKDNFKLIYPAENVRFRWS